MSNLPVSDPSAQGVDASAVLRLIDALEAHPQIEPHSLMLLRHGSVVARGWWAPYGADRPQLLYSLSKSFTSTALGIAIDEGLVSLDDTVISHFPELADEVTDPRSRRMLVRHVAAMASGHLEDLLEPAHGRTPGDLVRGLLTLPPEREPGTVFTYNQFCTYTVAEIVRRRSGQSLVEYLTPRLFAPLGITDVGWQRYEPGHEVSWSGLHLVTEAIAKLGQLYLQHGVWEGQQLVSAQWVAQATTPQVPTANSRPDPDWQQGYGFQFWGARHGYRGDGAYGQYCLVLPELDAVLAVTSASNDLQAVLDAVWEHLLPALAADAVASPDADKALAARLSSLELPLAPGRDPADPAAWATYRAPVTDDEMLASVDVAPGDKGWTVTLHGTDGSQLAATLQTGGWSVSEPLGPDRTRVPLAVSGGWTARGGLCVDIVFLETPHRVSLACALQPAAATTLWQTPTYTPTPLGEMRSPRLG